MPTKSLLAAFLIATVLIGGVLSWFASENPDGLEWSITKITGSAELPETTQGQSELANIQDKTTILPDYALPVTDGHGADASRTSANKRIGTSLAGIIGGAITLVICTAIGVLLRKRTSAQQVNLRRGQSTDK